MGKRGRQSQSQLLNALTKKQKKHLRDFGEEHPFYDRVSRKEAKPQICQLSESSDTSSSESEGESEPEQVSGYHRLLATLKNVSKEEEEEEEEEEESVVDEAEGNDEDDGSSVGVEEETATESTAMQESMALPADLEEKDGDRPAGTSQEAPEEFTDAKHESLFSLETNFLEEESGGNCSLKTSQDPFLQHVNKELKEKEIQAVDTNPKNTHQLKKELFLIMNSYRDLFYPERTALKNGEEIRHVYCLHVINHVLKANAQ
ncbi:hypothetical protein MC885_007888, partial [Smutsia gigantea]